MLWGRYASRVSEARYSQLWLGRQWAVCPSVQGPSGLNLYDLAGGRRHGTLTNMDAATDWVRSQGRYCLDFDGTNDYVGGFANIRAAFGMTISIWFRATNTSRSIHSLYSGSSDQNPDIYTHIEQVSGTTYRPNFYVHNGYVGAGTSFTLDDAWHHYAFCLSADGTVVRYYQDGRSLGSVANTKTIEQDNLTQSIGAIPGLIGSFQAQGQIDDVARYGRELTAGEIRLLATRRGIAYEARRDIVFGSTANRLRRIICGGNC